MPIYTWVERKTVCTSVHTSVGPLSLRQCLVCRTHCSCRSGFCTRVFRKQDFGTYHNSVNTIKQQQLSALNREAGYELPERDTNSDSSHLSKHQTPSLDLRFLEGIEGLYITKSILNPDRATVKVDQYDRHQDSFPFVWKNQLLQWEIKWSRLFH